MASYVGLFAPTSGDYVLTTSSKYLGMALPNTGGFAYGSQASTGGATPVGLEFGQGDQSTVMFRGMATWSMRDVALYGTVPSPGTIDSELTPRPNGNLQGTIVNRTSQTLVDATIVTANGYQVLGKLPPGSAATVNIAPTAGSTGGPQMDQIFQSIGQNDGALTAGSSSASSFGYFGPPGGAPLSIRGIRRTLGIRGGLWRRQGLLQWLRLQWQRRCHLL